MKQAILYLLLIWTIVTTIAPCTLFDDCSEKQTSQTTKNTEDKNCSNCAPLCICSHTNITAENTLLFSIKPPEPSAIYLNEGLSMRINSAHFPPPAQPPRQYPVIA